MKENNYSFRCKYRKAYNILIKIKLEELKKYINKEKNVQYEIISTNKFHNCKCILQNEEETNSVISIKKNENKINDDIELAQALIFTNIDKPFRFHKTNLENNNLYFSVNKIKWLLQKIREKNYINDNKFLEDITKITINFEQHNPDLKNLSLCHKYSSIINPKKIIFKKNILFFQPNFKLIF